MVVMVIYSHLQCQTCFYSTASASPLPISAIQSVAPEHASARLLLSTISYPHCVCGDSLIVIAHVDESYVEPIRHGGYIEQTSHGSTVISLIRILFRRAQVGL
jgi:hypothetical protein